MKEEIMKKMIFCAMIFGVSFVSFGMNKSKSAGESDSLKTPRNQSSATLTVQALDEIRREQRKQAREKRKGKHLSPAEKSGNRQPVQN